MTLAINSENAGLSVDKEGNIAKANTLVWLQQICKVIGFIMSYLPLLVIIVSLLS